MLTEIAWSILRQSEGCQKVAIGSIGSSPLRQAPYAASGARCCIRSEDLEPSLSVP